MDSDDYDALEDEEETVVQRLKKLLKNVPQQEASRPLVFGEKVNKMMVKLYNIRQNSKSHEEFHNLERMTQSLVDKAAKQGQLAVEARFLLEQAKNAHFKKDMQRTIDLSNEVIVKSQRLRPHETYQLQLICRFLMTSSYNHLRDFGTAWGILQQLQDAVEPTANYTDRWKLYYNMGTHYLAYLKTLGQPYPAVRSQAKQCFAKCRDAITAAIESGATFGIQEKIFPLVMMAKILLDTPETKPGQQRDEVTLEDLKETDTMIANIKEAIPVNLMGVRLKARLAITEAGLHFRKAQRYTKFAHSAKVRRQYDKYHTNIQSAYRKVSQSLICLDYTILMCQSAPYEEYQFAVDFTDYIDSFAQQNIHVDHSEEMAESDTTSSSTEDTLNTSRDTMSSVSVSTYTTETTELECNVSDKIHNLFTAGIGEKYYLHHPIPWYVLDKCIDDLNEIELLVNRRLPHHYSAVGSEPSVNHKLSLYPRLLMARIQIDFPETYWGMNRFDVTLENIQSASENLNCVKENIHPHKARGMFKVYYLLCEGGLYYRQGQMNHNMKKVKETKLNFTDAIFRIEHALHSLVNDVNSIKTDLENLLKLLNKVQMKLFKM